MSWKIYALAAALFAGLTAVFAKVGVQGISSNVATLVRTMVVVPLLMVFIQTQVGWSSIHNLSRKTWLFLILSGITTGLSWTFYFKAMQGGPASLVSAIDKFSLIFTIILAVAFLGEKLSAIQWIGCGFMVLGLYLVAVVR